MQTVVRRWAVGVGLLVGLGLWGGSADAAPHRRRDEGPLFVHTDTGQDAGVVARARMAKGDCAGALEAFDASLRSSIDFTLYRDRGLCHEQLGHPFPAIDDYRVYLTRVPEAPDAEQIRERLVRLEESNGVTAPRPKDDSAATRAEAEASASLSVGGGGVSASGGASAGAPAGGAAKNPHDYDDEESNYRKWEMAESSALRRSDGDIFGPFFGVRRLTTLTNVSSYDVGATIRKSLGAVSTLWGEIGYVNYKGSNSLNLLTGLSLAPSQVSAGGIMLAIGYEARLRLDQYTTNALVVGGGLDFQHISDTNSDVSSNHFFPRGKFGYRHVFGPAIGFELVGDIGYFFGVGSTLVVPNSTIYGGTVALLIAF